MISAKKLRKLDPAPCPSDSKGVHPALTKGKPSLEIFGFPLRITKKRAGIQTVESQGSASSLISKNSTSTVLECVLGSVKILFSNAGISIYWNLFPRDSTIWIARWPNTWLITQKWKTKACYLNSSPCLRRTKMLEGFSSGSMTVLPRSSCPNSSLSSKRFFFTTSSSNASAWSGSNFQNSPRMMLFSSTSSRINLLSCSTTATLRPLELNQQTPTLSLWPGSWDFWC